MGCLLALSERCSISRGEHPSLRQQTSGLLALSLDATSCTLAVFVLRSQTQSPRWAPVRHHTTLERLAGLRNLSHVTALHPAPALFLALSQLSGLRSLDLQQVSVHTLSRLQRLAGLPQLSRISLDLCHLGDMASLPHPELLASLPIDSLRLQTPLERLVTWIAASPLALRLRSLPLTGVDMQMVPPLPVDLRPLTLLHSFALRGWDGVRISLPSSLTSLDLLSGCTVIGGLAPAVR